MLAGSLKRTMAGIMGGPPGFFGVRGQLHLARPCWKLVSILPLPDRTFHPMRICIFGTGAVGSHFAVRLAQAGHDVSCVMRGPHLAAVKARGLTLRVGGTATNAKVKASDDPAALGPQDLVISTLKAT